MACILIVESDVEIRDGFVAPIEGAGHEVSIAASLARATLFLSEREPLDAILIGPSADRDALLSTILERRPNVPVLVFAPASDAERLLDVGVFDVLAAQSGSALLTRVSVALRHGRLTNEVRRLRDAAAHRTHSDDGLIGRSPAMRRVFDLFERVGDQTPVLVSGEDGTGSARAARTLHTRSRRQGSLVIFDGSRSSDEGSLSAAFERAAGGTLSIRHVDALSGALQTGLKDLIERAADGPRSKRADAPRVVSSTEVNLDRRVRVRRFHEELYYLLNAVHVRMPPLRRRGHDIILLAQHFLDKFTRTSERDILDFGPRAMERLLEYEWPGNVRELKSVIERAADVANYDQITSQDLPEAICNGGAKVAVVTRSPADMPTLETLEKHYVTQVLEATSGNKTRAAKVLGVDRRTLYRKLDRWAASKGASNQPIGIANENHLM